MDRPAFPSCLSPCIPVLFFIARENLSYIQIWFHTPAENTAFRIKSKLLKGHWGTTSLSSCNSPSFPLHLRQEILVLWIYYSFQRLCAAYAALPPWKMLLIFAHPQTHFSLLPSIFLPSLDPSSVWRWLLSLCFQSTVLFFLSWQLSKGLSA